MPISCAGLKPKAFDYDPHRTAPKVTPAIIRFAAGEIRQHLPPFFVCPRPGGIPRGKLASGPDGLLRPAYPTRNLRPVEHLWSDGSFKISLRELPQGGNFRITVKAARPTMPCCSILARKSRAAASAILPIYPPRLMRCSQSPRRVCIKTTSTAPGDAGSVLLKLGERVFWATP